MRHSTDYAYQLYEFFTSYLPKQQNLSAHTIKSYRETFRLFSKYCSDNKKINMEKLALDDISDKLILEFLDYLENERHNSINTRNQRLSAICSFFKYASRELPDALFPAQRIFMIPYKKCEKTLLSYLRAETIREILRQPDANSPFGFRDLVMLSVLYDTAARVSELCDIMARDVKFLNPTSILLHGKGSKPREIPVSKNTHTLLKIFIKQHNLLLPEKLNTPLFTNHRNERLTTEGVTYVLKKYVELAKPCCIDIPESVTPHIFRHSKAMHMLDAGVNLLYIRDFLGHENVKTTEIYAKTSPEKRRQAIEKAQPEWSETDLPDWTQDKGLLESLLNL